MDEPTRRAELTRTLGFETDPEAARIVALVGGGGKTTLAFALTRQLHGDVVLTTTTKMNPCRTEGLPVHWSPLDAETLRGAGRVIVWRDELDGKARGVDPAEPGEWSTVVDHVVVEADGARNRPFKAPAPHEPVIPPAATCVLAVIGADALDRVLEDQCFRPMRVAALARCSPYERLTPARAAAVLDHADGSRRGVPEGARFVVAVTKVGGSNAGLAASLARELAERGVEHVLIGDQPPGGA